MFANLSDRLSGVFDKLNNKATLSDDDVTIALREVRVALLEAMYHYQLRVILSKQYKQKHQAKL